MRKVKKVLICIDMQIDFIYRVLGTPEAREVVPKVVNKIKEAYDNPDTMVIFTADTHGKDYLDTLEGRYLPIKHTIYGTDGWEIIREIKEILCDVRDTIYLYAKDTFGIVQWGTRLSEVIDGIFDDKDIVFELIGVDTDICVVSNALILRSTFKDNEIVVDASCCAGSTPERHKAALEVMKSCQIKVIGE